MVAASCRSERYRPRRINGGYRPKNLQAWAERHGVDTKEIAGPVLALDLRTPALA